MTAQTERVRPSAFGLAAGCSAGLLVFCEALVLILEGPDLVALRIATLPATIPWLAVGWVKGRALFRALAWEVEEATGWDLDRDGQVGHAHHFVFTNVADEAARTQSERDLLDDAEFFIRGCYDGRGTAWRSWQGVRLPSGDKMTQTLWQEWVDRLERAGVARKEGNAGTRLLVSEGAALRTFGLQV